MNKTEIEMDKNRNSKGQKQRQKWTKQLFEKAQRKETQTDKKG